MKKILILTLTFLLLFSAVSCKKGDDTPEATTTATTVQNISEVHKPDAAAEYAKSYEITPPTVTNADGTVIHLTGVHIVDSLTPARDLARFSDTIHYWSYVTLGDNEYLNGLKVCASEKDLSREDFYYLFSYDHATQIPLLDEKGEEGRYVLYMLYDHGRLIAEIVVEKQSNEHYRIAKQLIISKSDYIGNRYMERHYFFEHEKVLRDAGSGKHYVGFDGEKYLAVKPAIVTTAY